MMIIEPTYKVRFYTPGPGTQEGVDLRVPRPSLEAIVHVLVFNGVGHFECTKETDPNG